MLNGRVDKAVKMLKKFERVNGKNVPPEIYEEFERNTISKLENDEQGNNYTVFHLFKLPRQARITMTLIIYWYIYEPFIRFLFTDIKLNISIDRIVCI